MSIRQAVDRKAIELGKEVLRMTTAAGSGHPSSALSILHMVIALMQHVIRWDPADPWNPASDRLILSEGHAVPAVYAVYADCRGLVGKAPDSSRILTLGDLKTLRETNSPLDGHPNPAEGFPFFDAATGSLGQGLSVAAGLGLAARLARLDRKLYVLIGDGESREGQIWEAMDFIADKSLTNVFPIFNCNRQGQADYVSDRQSPDALSEKSRAFGFDVRVIDGHDGEALRSAVAAPGAGGRPVAIIAKTQKGWGCASLRDVSNHGKPLAESQLQKGIDELDGMYAQLRLDRTAKIEIIPPKPAAAMRTDAKHIRTVPFADGMAAAGLDKAVQMNSLATRRAYGAALLALGGVDPRIVALDGDVRNSTFSEMFYKKYPDRFFECKIAEQNMVSVGAGLAATGLIPFASSFAKFIARAYDQIEMAQITRANLKLVGSHAGVTLAADGPSQMSLHDVAYFRCAASTDNGAGGPVCVSFHPADAVAAYHCTFLMANHVGMCYMRTHRPDVPLLYKPDNAFRIGGSHVVAEGDALTIVASGYMVHECRKALDRLDKLGRRCTLIDAYSFPLEAGPILERAARTGGRILCVEDNYVGGLGSAVAEAAAAGGDLRVASMTCRILPKSARTTDEILDYVSLSATHIAQRAAAMF